MWQSKIAQLDITPIGWIVIAVLALVTIAILHQCMIRIGQKLAPVLFLFLIVVGIGLWFDPRGTASRLVGISEAVQTRMEIVVNTLKNKPGKDEKASLQPGAETAEMKH